jgi:hypothetical protein
MYNPLIPNMAQPQRNGFSTDLTASDFSSDMPVHGKGILNVAFFHTRVKIENAADPVLDGTFDVRLCVAKHPIGDRLTTSTRYITDEEAKRMFPAEYKAFKENQDTMPLQGTPLHELPGVTMSQIGIMFIHGLRSVEDIASMPRDTINGMGLEAVSIYELATRWLARKAESKGMIQGAKQDAFDQAKMRAMEHELARMREENSRLQGQVDLAMRIAPQQGGQDAQQATVQMVDRTDMPDMSDDEDPLFSGSGGMVQGLSDLNDDDPLGLNR